jgi:hypothetical protein
VIAVFVHALVDYPFARFGITAWFFVLAGALAAIEAERIVRERSPSARPLNSVAAGAGVAVGGARNCERSRAVPLQRGHPDSIQTCRLAYRKVAHKL